jgi:BMFP domain-containing protein YqiC
MGVFDQFKAASSMMKDMDPKQMKEMMAQAKEAQKMLEKQIKKIVEEEIKKRDLVGRDEVRKMIENAR